MAADIATFHWADYLVFSGVLFLSAAIGVFFSIKTRRKLQRSPEHLLTGDKKLSIIPVCLSLVVTFISAVTIIGVPTEVYVNGGNYWLVGISLVPAGFAVALLYIPIYYKLGMTSAYEYLEIRFSKPIRLVGSGVFIFEMVVYMGLALYVPALALSQVTGLSMTISILGIGLVCSFYTSVGGIKAVVWTDVLQILVIFAGSLALLIQGVIDAGGWEKVFETSRNGRRMPYFEWNPNPTVRHSFCSTFIGGFFTFLTIGGSNQATIQRYLSTRSIRSSQIAVLGQVVLSGVILCLSVLTGLVIYARYHVCDPFLAGKISKLDKIVPLFMMETLGFLPGLPGLFVACLFSAALSTVSSGVNSLAAVTMVDFLKPGLQKCTGTTLSARTFSILTILIAILYGLVTIGVAYLAGKMGKEVIQIALSIFGMIGGPLLGLMSVGIFFPCINSWGAGAGLFVSLVICLWAGIGPIINPGPPNFLPLLTSGCKVVIPANMTTTVLTTVSTTLITTSNITSAPPILESRNPFRDWYSLSYLHYATVSVIVSVFIGLLISAGTGFNRHRTLDPRTFYDVCGCYKGKPSTSSYDLRQLDPYMPRQYKDKPQEYENPGFYNNNVKRLDERDGDPYYY